MEYCHLNEAPNIIKCLRDYCIDGLPPAFTNVCKFLLPAPDDKNAKDMIASMIETQFGGTKRNDEL